MAKPTQNNSKPSASGPAAATAAREGNGRAADTGEAKGQGSGDGREAPDLDDGEQGGSGSQGYDSFGVEYNRHNETAKMPVPDLSALGQRGEAARPSPPPSANHEHPLTPGGPAPRTASGRGRGSARPVPTEAHGSRRGGNALDRLFLGQMLYRSAATAARGLGLEPLMPLVLVSGIALLGAGKATLAVGKAAGRGLSNHMGPLMDRLRGGDANQRELASYLDKLNGQDESIRTFNMRWAPTVSRVTGRDVSAPAPDPFVPITMTNWVEASRAKSGIMRDAKNAESVRAGREPKGSSWEKSSVRHLDESDLVATSKLDVRRHGRHLLVRQSQFNAAISRLYARRQTDDICDTLGRGAQGFRCKGEKDAQELFDRIRGDIGCLAYQRGDTILCIATPAEMARATALSAEYGAETQELGPIAPGDERLAEEMPQGPGNDELDEEELATEPRDAQDRGDGREVGEDGLGPEGDAPSAPMLTDEQVRGFRQMAEIGLIDAAELEAALREGPEAVMDLAGRSVPRGGVDEPSQDQAARGRDIVGETQAAERREDIGNNQTTADYVQSRPNSNDSDRSTPWSDGEDAPGLGDKDGDGVMDSAEDVDGDGTPDHEEEHDRTPKPNEREKEPEDDYPLPGKTRGADGSFSSPKLSELDKTTAADRAATGRGREQERERPRGPQVK